MKRFLSFCLCLFLLTSVCFAEGEEVTDNLYVIETLSETLPEVDNFDDSVSDLDGSVAHESLAEGDQIPFEGENEVSDPVIDEISTDSLTVNANEVVLYSLLPEEDFYPSGAPLEGGVYMHLDTDELGDILVYVPVDYQYDSFTLNTNGQPINITASQISGYSYDGNDYNIRWSSFGVPTYRPVDYDYGTQYQTLTVNEILGTNIGFWAEGGVSYNYMLMYIMLGGLILIIALKIIGK